MELIKVIDRTEFEKKMSNELHQIFENLEEGILLFKNDSVNFTNALFRTILKNVNLINDDRLWIQEGSLDHILDCKIFKVFRGGVNNSSASGSERNVCMKLSRSNESEYIKKFYSLR
jgi:hypothetical protein